MPSPSAAEQLMEFARSAQRTDDELIREYERLWAYVTNDMYWSDGKTDHEPVEFKGEMEIDPEFEIVNGKLRRKKNDEQTTEARSYRVVNGSYSTISSCRNPFG